MLVWPHWQERRLIQMNPKGNCYLLVLQAHLQCMRMCQSNVLWGDVCVCFALVFVGGHDSFSRVCDHPSSSLSSCSSSYMESAFQMWSCSFLLDTAHTDPAHALHLLLSDRLWLFSPWSILPHTVPLFILISQHFSLPSNRTVLTLLPWNIDRWLEIFNVSFTCALSAFWGSFQLFVLDFEWKESESSCPSWEDR